ncbi:MAG: DUF3349 domain-containing protein [Nocardioides sp.]|uniref:DUF3349 domain-containing protein n=1 Tax=Nocardioides sp. TaxID=35761 RepID=UPI0039E22D68
MAVLEDVVRRVLGWLRQGYPDGVPSQDYVALYGILRRHLTLEEMDHLVHALEAEAQSGYTHLSAALIENRAEDVLQGPVLEDDLARVSARLAAAGWPLATPDRPIAPPASGGMVARVLSWLQEGYPSGVPSQDVTPLLALLRRRLSDEEVATVSHALIDAGTMPPDRVDVGTAIASVTSELPSESDIQRVRRYLLEHGWPTDLAV